VAGSSLAARDFFVSRIVRQAQQEGSPLTPVQLEFLENGGTFSRQEESEFDKENPEYLKFIEWVTALASRAMAGEICRDPEAGRKYGAALEELDKAESGSPLWFAVVPAVHPPEQQSGVRFVWVIVAGILLVGWAIGFYLTKRSLW
jgi:hypothetical protein